MKKTHFKKSDNIFDKINPLYSLKKSQLIHVWVHVSCLLYTPEIDLRRGKFYGLKKLKKKSFLKECFVCGVIDGHVIKCQHKKCTNHIHAECGIRSN